MDKAMIANWLLYKLFFFFKYHPVSWSHLFYHLKLVHGLSVLVSLVPPCPSLSCATLYNPNVWLVIWNPDGKPSVTPPCYPHPTKTKTPVTICALTGTQTPILLPHFKMSCNRGDDILPLYKEFHTDITSSCIETTCSRAWGRSRQAGRYRSFIPTTIKGVLMNSCRMTQRLYQRLLSFFLPSMKGAYW